MLFRRQRRAGGIEMEMEPLQPSTPSAAHVTAPAATQRSSRYVTALVAGMFFITSPTAPATAEPAKLTVTWEYATPLLFPQAIVVDQKGRDSLYVALKNGGLGILDISRPDVAPRNLARIGTNELGGLDVMHLTQQDNLLYLALGDFFDVKGSPAGLAVVSVADPRAPKVHGIWKSPEIFQGAACVLVEDHYAYLGGMGHGVFILDVRNSKNVRKVAEILPEVNFPRKNPNKVQHPNARGLALKGQHLYVAFDAGGLRVINVANPLKPQEIGRYANRGMKEKQQAYNNLVIDGTTAYVATDYAGMEVLDIRDPRNIKPVAWLNLWKSDTLENLWFNSPGHTNQIEYDEKRQLVYMSAGDSELLVVDVSERTKPKLMARYGAPKDKLGAWGLTLASDHVYLAYITASVPFHGTWSGIKAIRR
ncbi:MAG: hypothetical protein WCJ09_11980 [Planctomycetota bacterium]